jgi:hypothetical protein
MRFWKFATLLAASGLLAGLIVSYLVTPRFVSRAVMTMRQPNPNGSLANYLSELKNEILSRISLSSIMQEPRLDLYAADRARMPLEDVIDRMRSTDISIASTGNAGPNYLAFEISFGYRDRLKAQQTVQALITHFVEANLRQQVVPAFVKRGRSYEHIDRLEARIRALELRLGMPLSPPELPGERELVDDAVTISVLDPPSLPIYPEYPQRQVFMAIGAVCGLCVAGLIGMKENTMNAGTAGYRGLYRRA